MLANYNNLSDSQKRAAILIDIYYKGKRNFIIPFIISYRKNKDIKPIKEMASLIGIKSNQMASWRDEPEDKRKAQFLLNADFINYGVAKFGLEKFIVSMVEKNDYNPILIYRIAEVLGVAVDEIYRISKGPEGQSPNEESNEKPFESTISINFEDQTLYVRGLADIYEFVCLLPTFADFKKLAESNQSIKEIFSSEFNEREYSRKLASVFGEEIAKAMLERIKFIYSEYKKGAVNNEQKAKKEATPNVIASVISRKENLREIIQRYIDSDSTDIEAYSLKGGVQPDTFRRALKSIKDFYPDLYQKYLEKESIDKDVIGEKLKEQIARVIFLLENGIELEDGVTRPFDIIDYYQIINIPPRNISRYFRFFNSSDDLKKFKSFIKSSRGYSLLDVDKIKLITYSINEGGKERQITDQEKEAIVNYLTNNGISLLTSNFDAAIRRYSRGFLSLDGIDKPDKTY